MAGSINRSFRLLGASWSLLGRDPKLSCSRSLR